MSAAASSSLTDNLAHIIVSWLTFFLLSFDIAAARAQPTGESFNFAYDRVRTVKLVERKEILNYQVEPLVERRFRETYFDSDDMTLLRRGMFYRLRESFDGKARLEFRNGAAADPAGALQSVALSASQLMAAREGQINQVDGLIKQLPLPSGKDGKKIQLTAEYERHGVTLSRGDKAEFVVSLLVGTIEGFSGRKLRKEFWGLEVEPLGRAGAAELRELKRIRDYLVDDLKFQRDAKSLYAYGIDKAVRLRPDEVRLEAVNILGGSRGKALDQFDEPDALAFTLDGRLIAADTDNARFKIYGFSNNLQSLQIVGREGSAAGEFGHGLAFKSRGLTVYHQVQGIAVDKNGLIFVIDQGNQRVQVFSPDGGVVPGKAIPLKYCPSETPRCAGAIGRSLKGQYTSLQGLAIDQDGAVFLSDSGTSKIYRYLPNGELDTNFKIPELHPVTQEPLLREPESMATYGDKLFIASEGSADIKIVDHKTGAPIAPISFGADVFDGDVEGLAISGDYLFAVDPNSSRIVVFDLKSTPPKFLMGFVGDHESADGIAVDPTGKYVAVADQGNLRVVLFSLPEIMKHLAQFDSRK